LHSLEGIIAFIIVCSTDNSIYSERLVSILTEVIEGTYGEPLAASSGHGSSGSRDGVVAVTDGGS